MFDEKSYNLKMDKTIEVFSKELSSLRTFFFQAEDGIRDQPRSRGLGDVYKRQLLDGSGGRRQWQPTAAESQANVSEISVDQP